MDLIDRESLEYEKEYNRNIMKKLMFNEKSIYRTPEISEFIEGFEFEWNSTSYSSFIINNGKEVPNTQIKETKQWDKMIYSKKFESYTYFWSRSILESLVKEKKVRVRI